MAPLIPSVEPTLATAGSTWTWKASSPDFPISESWTLAYAIRGVSSLVWSTDWISNDGAQFTIEIPPASTLLLTPGRYEITRIWTGSGSYAGERHTEALPALTVQADPVTAAAGDRQTFAEKNLAYVEAALSGRFADDMPSNYTIGGRQVTKMTVAELWTARAKLRLEVWRERNPGKAYPSSYVRFNRVGG